MKRAMTAMAALLLTAACGGNGDGDESQSAAGTQRVRVVISDSVPLRVYANLDDEKCWAGDYATGEAKGGVLPSVTIEDGEGRILATREAPLVGGVNTEAGCEVPVEFADVEVTDFYKVTVTAPDGSGERTVEGSSTEIIVAVD